LILKIDLKKTYDCICWDYLKLVLLQCGFGLPMTNWILGCITSTTYAILINGEPTCFFNNERGLRQGCPLSPLPFILIMEGLSLALKISKEEGLLTGIKVSRLHKIIHLLFVDDILIMAKASIGEWQEIKRVLDVFCRASGLKINENKTTFLQHGVQQQDLEILQANFHFNFVDLSSGFRYLGYFLKIDRYKTKDWNSLIDMYEAQINHWCNRQLSIGGHCVLIKVVLESQPVYWLALANLPSSILQKIRQLIYEFMWSGCNKKKKFHLCAWQLLARPKKFEGWGLRDLGIFSRAMADNTLWRALIQEGLWHRILKDKYYPYVTVERWLRTVIVVDVKAS